MGLEQTVLFCTMAGAPCVRFQLTRTWILNDNGKKYNKKT